MTRPLDGTPLLSYYRRLKLSKEAQELLTNIRTSPPNRSPRANRGNVPVWYPSKKMGCIIKAESHKVEFAFLLQTEHDDDVLEMWDQPPAIQLEYKDKSERLQRPQHTADYFLFCYLQAGWVECKPTKKLIQLSKTQPNRYHLDELGQWRCPPGEAFAAKHGLFYHVFASEKINWAAQDNWLYLEDYYQDLDKLKIAEPDLDTLMQVVRENPGILLADLQQSVAGLPTDTINIAIARQTIYVDLAKHRLTDPWRTPVFLSRAVARAVAAQCEQDIDPDNLTSGDGLVVGTRATWAGQRWQISEVTSTTVKLEHEGAEPFSMARSAFDALVQERTIVCRRPFLSTNFTAEGQDLLDQARDVDATAAVFRNRVIHPLQYDDDEQIEIAERAAKVPPRTKRRWRQWFREGEVQYGSGLIGLLPRYTLRGRRVDPKSAARNLIEEVLETYYDTTTRRPTPGAYGEYVIRSEEQHLPKVSRRTFYRVVACHEPKYKRIAAREGTRAAYPFKDYWHEQEYTISRHGNYAWSMGYLDHTELDLILHDSRTSLILGKCWLSMLILSHPRRLASYVLTFDEPSYRSCMMVLRLCGKRFGRFPTAITVDGGPEFRSIYFELLLALYRVRKHQRPASEPRFGSPQERLLGTMDTELLYHLLGNTQSLRVPRLQTKDTDPQRQAVWTLPALAAQVRQWADEEYDTLRHPALGMSPRQAYELSMQRDGERLHKTFDYDDAFIMATCPTTKDGVAKVEAGVGVRMNYLDYWCEAMRDATVEDTYVEVRYDPFDVRVGYARIRGRWRECQCPYTEFAGCSERELHMLIEELRKRNRLQYGREQTEMTQKQLAAMRRQTTDVEAVLRQQRNDLENRAAYAVLERSISVADVLASREIALAPVKVGLSGRPLAPIRSSKPVGKLDVLKRIEIEL